MFESRLNQVSNFQRKVWGTATTTKALLGPRCFATRGQKWPKWRSIKCFKHFCFRLVRKIVYFVLGLESIIIIFLASPIFQRAENDSCLLLLCFEVSALSVTVWCSYANPLKPNVKRKQLPALQLPPHLHKYHKKFCWTLMYKQNKLFFFKWDIFRSVVWWNVRHEWLSQISSIFRWTFASA